MEEDLPVIERFLHTGVVDWLGCIWCKEIPNSLQLPIAVGVRQACCCCCYARAHSLTILFGRHRVLLGPVSYYPTFCLLHTDGP